MTKVLIADDDPHILMLTRLILQNQGYELIQANNGQEAIDFAIKEEPDIVFSDIMMPKKGGFDVCRTLKANPKLSHIPIVLLSALQDNQYQENSIQEGASEYIHKPFELNDLNKCIQRFVIKKSQKPPFETSQDQESQSPKRTTSFTFTNPWPEIIKTTPLKEHSLLIKGDPSCGKNSFISPFLKPFLNSITSQSIWITYNTPPHRLMRSLYAQFGSLIESACKEKRFFLINATPSKKLNKHTYIINIDNRYDLNHLLNLIYDLKSLYKSQTQERQACLVFDNINPLINYSQNTLGLLDFFQILSQDEDFFGDDLLLISQDLQNLNKHFSLGHLIDIEICLKYNNTQFLAKQSVSKSLTKNQWQSWKKD